MRRPLPPPARPVTRLAKPLPKLKACVQGDARDDEVSRRAPLQARLRVIDRIRSVRPDAAGGRSEPC